MHNEDSGSQDGIGALLVGRQTPKNITIRACCVHQVLQRNEFFHFDFEFFGLIEINQYSIDVPIGFYVLFHLLHQI